MRKVFRKFCTRTVFNGIPDWYLAKHVVDKLAWTIILLGTFGGLCYHSYYTAREYLKHQTVSKLSYTRVQYLRFPELTICDSGRFNSSYIENAISLSPASKPPGYTEQQIRTEFVKYFMSLAYQPLSKDWSPNLEQYLQATYDYNFNTSAKSDALDVQEFMMQAAYRCPDMFPICVFTGKNFSCCQNDTSRLVLTDYGMCYHVKVRFAGHTRNLWQTC